MRSFTGYRLLTGEVKEQLAKSSQSRFKKDPALLRFLKDAERFKKIRDRKSVSLNEKQRLKEYYDEKAAAEKMEDLSTFQSLGKLLSPKFSSPQAKMPGHKPYPGKVVSQGGLIRTSSSSHENPCAHWGVLEPVGGHFHTNKEENPWVAILLPKQAFVTGVVIITTSGNMQRLHNMKVQVSETGKDNDWHDVAQLGPCKQRVIQVDLSDKKPRAKYVRIVRTGGPDFFHLNAIYVYGEQAA